MDEEPSQMSALERDDSMRVGVELEATHVGGADHALEGH